MATSTFKVGDLLSTLGARGIEKQLKRILGVGKTSVNPVTGDATVVYDDAKASKAAIKAAIKECGYHCAGESLPKHLCEDHPTPKKPQTAKPVKAPAKLADAHAGMPMPMSPEGKTSANAEHGSHASGQTDAMAQEMGHGAGHDMDAMVRDMRNRFWIADRKSTRLNSSHG